MLKMLQNIIEKGESFSDDLNYNNNLYDSDTNYHQHNLTKRFDSNA